MSRRATNFPFSGTAKSVQGLPVSQSLARVNWRRLQIDEGLGHEISHRIEGRFGKIVVQVLASGESADP